MGLYLGPFRLTRRGVRVRIGPRAARLHIGAGGAGLSTGAGPFTYYKPLRGKRRAPAAKTTRRMNMADARPPRPDNGPHTDPLLPPVQYQEYQRPPRKPWSRRRKIILWSLAGVVALFVLIGTLGGSPRTPVSHHNAPVIPAVTATSSPAAPSPAAVVAKSPAPQPQPTTQQPVAQQTTPAPVHTTTTAPQPPPPAPGCSPKTASGNCYQPGEFCSAAEHGMTGVAGDGAQIECENTDPGSTWHWVAI
jgi:hypothetical protein